jgi:hypothetical protein
MVLCKMLARSIYKTNCEPILVCRYLHVRKPCPWTISHLINNAKTRRENIFILGVWWSGEAGRDKFGSHLEKVEFTKQGHT